MCFFKTNIYKLIEKNYNKVFLIFLSLFYRYRVRPSVRLFMLIKYDICILQSLKDIFHLISERPIFRVLMYLHSLCSFQMLHVEGVEHTESVSSSYGLKTRLYRYVEVISVREVSKN